eukprot:1133677-Amphidinium_carterae.1
MAATSPNLNAWLVQRPARVETTQVVVEIADVEIAVDQIVMASEHWCPVVPPQPSGTGSTALDPA